MHLQPRLIPIGRPRLHRGALMPSRDIGQLRIVKTVKSSQDVEIEARESISFSVVQLVNRTGLAMGHQVHFYRPPRSARHIGDRKSTRLNSSHVAISYAVFCLKKK